MKFTVIGAVRFRPAMVCALGHCVTGVSAWQSDNGDGAFTNPPLCAGYGSVKIYRDVLKQTGIKNVYHESPGAAHKRLTYRWSLHEFAPLRQ